MAFVANHTHNLLPAIEYNITDSLSAILLCYTSPLLRRASSLDLFLLCPCCRPQCMPGTWQGRVQRIKAQKAQKRVYDKRSRELNLKAGERVLVYMPKEKASKAYKFAHPFHGSFRVRRGYCVAFDGARRCPTEVQEGASWPSPERERTQTHAQDQTKILYFLYLKRKKFPHQEC